MPDGRRAPTPILFVHSGRDWIRGSERCLLDLVAGLDRARFTPVVWCDSDVLAAAVRDLGATVEVSREGWDSCVSLLPSRSAVRQARDVMRRHGARLVHVNDDMPLKATVLAARAARLPTVFHVHLPSTDYERCYMGAHQAAIVVAVSRSTAQGFLADGMPPSRVRVIYNGVDPARLAAGDATGLRASLGIAPDEVVLAAVGSLIARKGVDTLLRAFALLRERGGPRTRLLLVGDGTERGELEALACALGLDREGAVRFLGERGDVGAILRDAVDVAVSAAREEAFPLNLLEAALFGLPTVASAIPPHRESVVDGETGLLAAPPDDPAALAAALHALAADPALRQRLGAAGRARVERDFLVSRYVANFEALYEELLGRPAGAYGWLRGTSFPPIYRRWIGAAVRRRLPGGRRG